MADSSKDFAKMKVADLKRELKLRGLSTVGNKQELQERLLTATSDPADSSLLLLEDGPVADAEDILNEDEVLAEDEDDADADDDAELEATPDDGCADSSKRLLEDSEEELDSGITSSPGAKQGTTSTQGSAKKIILNRKGPVAVPVPSPGKENVAVSKPEEPSDKNIIKLSAVSMEKRLELRAAKFGPPTSETSKKEARVARFGSTSSTPAPASISTGSSVSAEVLKKRAERFGLVAGSASEKAELEEKKRKRLERFGNTSTKPATAAATAAATASATNGATTASTKVAVTVAATASNKTPITAPTSGDASLEEKKRLRAERFKITAK